MKKKIIIKSLLKKSTSDQVFDQCSIDEIGYEYIAQTKELSSRELEFFYYLTFFFRKKRCREDN